jgi:hypothetical protein
LKIINIGNGGTGWEGNGLSGIRVQKKLPCLEIKVSVFGTVYIIIKEELKDFFIQVTIYLVSAYVYTIILDLTRKSISRNQTGTL